MQYNACNIAYAIWHMQYSPWCVWWLQRLVTGSTQTLFVYPVPGMLEGYFFQSFSYAGKLGFVVTKIQVGETFGFARTRKSRKLYWSLGGFETLYLGFSETWAKTKGFDLQSHSSRQMCIQPALYTHLWCLQLQWLPFPVLKKCFLTPNLASLSPWLLALYKRMQGVDYLLCCSRMYPLHLFSRLNEPHFTNTPLGLWQELGPNDR